MSGKTVTLPVGKVCRVGEDVRITAVRSKAGSVTIQIEAPREKRIEWDVAEEKQDDSARQNPVT